MSKYRTSVPRLPLRSAIATLILLLVLPAKVAALETPSTAHALSQASEHANVARAFLRAVCNREDASALSMLAPGARVVQSWWGLDHKEIPHVFSYLLSRPGSETAMLETMRVSACLPMTDLEVRGEVVTWRQDMWPEPDADLGEEHVRWHSQAQVTEGQLTDLTRAAAVPGRGLPPPPANVSRTGGSTGGSTSGSSRGSTSGSASAAEASPVVNSTADPRLERAPVTISLGPSEVGWPLILLPGLAGAVTLLRTRSKRRCH